jgi:uncharacterized Zn finger protein (UPF0148 family)
MTDLPPADDQRRFNADYPWCPDCGHWRAESKTSTRCPICDPEPYKTRTDHSTAAAVDSERRSSQRIVARAQELAQWEAS